MIVAGPSGYVDGSSIREAPVITFLWVHTFPLRCVLSFPYFEHRLDVVERPQSQGGSHLADVGGLVRQAVSLAHDRC